MRIFFSLIAITLSSIVMAQSTKASYAVMAAKAEESVWGTKDTLFDNNKLPDGYQNESAVILARKEKFESEKKGFALPLLIIAIDTRKVLYYKTFREKVFLNDKAAIEKYAEMSFLKIANKITFFGYVGNNYEYSFLGIRIIKPNGKVTKINIDEEKVVLSSSRTEEQQKIAIPNLEVGDVVDYYVQIATRNYQNYFFTFYEGETIQMAAEYPIYKHQIEILVDKKHALAYETGGNVPKFIEHTDEDGAMSLKGTGYYITKVKDEKWNNAYRTSAFLNIKFSTKQLTFGKKKVKIGTMARLTEDELLATLLENVGSFLNSQIAPIEILNKGYKANTQDGDEYRIKYFENKLEELLKNRTGEKPGKLIKNGDEEVVFETLLDVFSHHMLANVYAIDHLTGAISGFNNRPVDPRYYSAPIQSTQLWWLFTFARILNDNKIKCSFIASPQRIFFTLNHAIDDVNNLHFGLKCSINGRDRFLWFEGPYNIAEHIPPYIDNENHLELDYELLDSRKYQNAPLGFFQLGKVNPNQNKQFEKMSITINESNNSLINVRKISQNTGHFKAQKQENLILPDSLIRRISKRIDLSPNEYFEKISKQKNLKVYITTLNLRTEQNKKNEKDRYIKELTEELNEKPKDLISYGILKDGLEKKDTQFIFATHFTIDNFVKKAGQNYLVDLGKLIGPHTEVKTNEKERVSDIYMPYPRTYAYQLELAIPAGYQALGLENFNKRVENETGGFVSSAVEKDGKVVVEVKKYYAHGYEPAANWGKMTAFLDAAIAFTKEKLLLKKK
jgi:hypothetical protein